MQFSFEQFGELLTPTINSGDVQRFDTMFAENELFSLDDLDVDFSQALMQRDECTLTKNKDNNESYHDIQQLQNDLLPMFESSDMGELDRTEMSFDLPPLNEYLARTTFPACEADGIDSLISGDSTLPWVSQECTVESKDTNDVTILSSPVHLSESTSSSVPKAKTTRNTDLSMNERRSRKKNQNKLAAERYRKKKQTEKNDLAARHLSLKNQNRELKSELENLSFRLESFKQLLIDVLDIKIPRNQSN